MDKRKKLFTIGGGVVALALIIVVLMCTVFRDPMKVNKKVYMNPEKDVETRVEALLKQMTLEEKAAQMVQPEQADITVEEVKQYGVGSVLSGGGSAPESGNTADDWQTRVNELKQASLETRLGIPLLYGVDAVHGHSNIDGATIYPHNIGLGSANDEDLMTRIGAAVAEEVSATGIQWTFAPTLANPQNELWGRTYEGYSERAEDVAILGKAFIEGAQGEKGTDEYLTGSHILATAKHYIGEGYTDGINQGNVNMEYSEFEELLDETLLEPYIAAVNSGVRTVMVSYNSVDGVKCHENSILVNDILKGELGFTGLVVGDYNGVQQVSGDSYKDQVANAVNAGVDLLMEPYSWREVIQYIIEGVEDGSISEERVDDAVRRILRVKLEAGLFEEEINSEEENQLKDNFGSSEHRELAREAVRKSMVLLKNDKVGDQTAMEALANAKNIMVVGSKADNIGVQCGGWTISWQGGMGNTIEGTTILEGLQNAAGDRTINYSAVGNTDGTEDAIIVVVGELPYAETEGDRSSSTLTLSSNDLNILNNMEDDIKVAKENGTPVIMVLMTGRPVDISSYVNQFDAIVEAWLPGTEGDGVADVLFGDYDFTGTLTYTWTWYPSDIDDKFQDGMDDKILFKYGTGLTKDGSSINKEGTAKIGKKPEKSEEEEEIAVGSINLEDTNYIVEAEVLDSGSYLVTKGNENNISFVENWGGAWANAKWKVWVPQSGNYRLHFYIASDTDTRSLEIYYASPTIVDDGQANKTAVPITTTESMMEYQDFTLDITVDSGNYEFKFMNNTESNIDVRLDRIEFEYLGE